MVLGKVCIYTIITNSLYFWQLPVLLKRLIPYIVLAIAVLLIYGQISPWGHMLKWDAADAYFPWRYFLGNSVRQGFFPAWNPYQQCGYPFFADPQSGAFYPLAILLGLPAGYGVYLFEFEFLLTLFIAGWGMYQLASVLDSDRRVRLFCAIAYAGCGFFVGQAEHFTWIVSAAWLPWIFWSYERMLGLRKWGYALLCAIFINLLLTGGYIAFVIIVMYLLLFMGVAHAVRHGRQKGFSSLLKLHGIMAVALLALSLVAIVSYAEAANYITRGEGLTLAKAQIGPFSPQSSISFLLPFASLKDAPWFGTDVSMTNGYMGLVTLVLMIAALAGLGNKKNWVLFLLGLLLLLVSFGEAVPLRGILYNYLPLMKLFRFPSLFRVFAFIPLILLAGQGMRTLQGDSARFRKVVVAVAAILMAVFVGIWVVYLGRPHATIDIRLLLSDINAFYKSSDYPTHIIIQAVIQLFILAALVLLVLMLRGRKQLVPTLIALCIVDMAVAGRMNLPATGCTDFTSKEGAAALQHMPDRFPTPDAGRPMATNNYGRFAERIKPWTNNVGNYLCETCVDGYNPFLPSNYDHLADDRVLHDKVWQNGLLYLCDKVVTMEAMDTVTDVRACFVSADRYLQMKNGRYSIEGSTVRIGFFRPGHVVGNVHLQDSGIVVLQQTNYPGWKVQIDGKKVEDVFSSAYANMSFVAGPGEHVVDYEFKPWYLLPLGGLSIASCIGFIFLLVRYRREVL